MELIVEDCLSIPIPTNSHLNRITHHCPSINNQTPISRENSTNYIVVVSYNYNYNVLTKF